MAQMMDGNLVVTEHPRQHYRTVFNRKTGFFARKEDAGWAEPMWAEDGPELIDLSITSYCERKCSFCYRGANNESYVTMSLDDVVHVVEQAKVCGTLQIALGGGNPNQHPQFVEILRLIRETGIVPSYTTNGDGLTDEVLEATAKYCGAMAISVYEPYSVRHYEQLLNRVTERRIKVNLHAIMRSDNIGLWTGWLENPPSLFDYANAIIFLNYKPIQSGTSHLMVKDEETLKRFFMAANTCKGVKIGFDSCGMSGIVQWMTIPRMFLEPCEAAKFSCFISEDMKMYPCSFMAGNMEGADLRQQTLVGIWQNHKSFVEFRESKAMGKCSCCKHWNFCNGGCKFLPEINFCNL